MQSEVELISVDEFIKEVWEVEHVKINITPKNGIKPGIAKLFRLPHYPYTEPIDGNKTVSEFLNERIRPCIPITLFMGSVKDDNDGLIGIF